ncbi:hypothetical protein AKJ36_03455, partial [candidate division MSBL1 archaeon SCGC-AAA259I07]
TVFLTEEAREKLADYMEWRKDNQKRDGEPYDKTDKIFPFTRENATQILETALNNANMDVRDNKTGRNKIHIHSTRKFFRSNCGLEDALTHAIMGHREYLDGSYLRVDPDRAAEEFAANMDNLQVMENRSTTEARLRETQIETLKAAIKAQGISEEKINRAMDDWAAAERVRGEMPDEEVMGILRSPPYQGVDLGEINREEFEELKEKLLELVSEPEDTQRLIDQNNLENYLDSGWRYVDQNGTKVIVEGPANAKDPEKMKKTSEDVIKNLLSQELNATLIGTDNPKGPDYIDEEERIAVNFLKITSPSHTSAIVKRSAEWLHKYKKEWRKVLAIQTYEELEELVLESIPENLKVELFLIVKGGKPDELFLEKL